MNQKRVETLGEVNLKRTLRMEPSIAKAPAGRSSGGRPSSTETPRQFHVVGTGLPREAAPADAEREAARQAAEERAWLTLPKGIILGLLLAIPFWLAVAGLAYWLL